MKKRNIIIYVWIFLAASMLAQNISPDVQVSIGLKELFSRKPDYTKMLRYYQYTATDPVKNHVSYVLSDETGSAIREAGLKPEDKGKNLAAFGNRNPVRLKKLWNMNRDLIFAALTREDYEKLYLKEKVEGLIDYRSSEKYPVHLNLLKNLCTKKCEHTRWDSYEIARQDADNLSFWYRRTLENNDAVVLDILIEIYLHYTDKEDQLIRAVAKQDIKTIDLILKSGEVDVNMEIQRTGDKGTKIRGRTLLFEPAYFGNLDVVKVLVNHKANVNAADQDGTTILMTAANRGSADVVNFLIDSGASIQATNKDNYNALRFAVLKEKNEKVIEQLIKKGIDINNKSGNGGYTALHTSAQEGFASYVKILLDNKADVNIRSTDGSTPLKLAINENRVEVIKQLVKAPDFNINSVMDDVNGDTPLMYALRGKTTVMDIKYAGERARANGVNPEIVEILINAGADINYRNKNGETAILLASLSNSEDSVKLLINSKADINAKNRYGDTALVIASEKGNKAMVDLLKSSGAKIYGYLNPAERVPAQTFSWILGGAGVLSAGGIFVAALLNSKEMYDPRNNSIVLIPDPTLTYISIAPLVVMPIIALIVAPRVPRNYALNMDLHSDRFMTGILYQF